MVFPTWTLFLESIVLRTPDGRAECRARSSDRPRTPTPCPTPQSPLKLGKAGSDSLRQGPGIDQPALFELVRGTEHPADPLQPGRPMQNGHVESFIGRLRDECLNANWFRNLLDARAKITA